MGGPGPELHDGWVSFWDGQKIHGTLQGNSREVRTCPSYTILPWRTLYLKTPCSSITCYNLVLDTPNEKTVYISLKLFHSKIKAHCIFSPFSLMWLNWWTNYFHITTGGSEHPQSQWVPITDSNPYSQMKAKLHHCENTVLIKIFPEPKAALSSHKLDCILGYRKNWIWSSVWDHPSHNAYKRWPNFAFLRPVLTGVLTVVGGGADIFKSR